MVLILVSQNIQSKPILIAREYWVIFFVIIEGFNMQMLNIIQNMSKNAFKEEYYEPHKSACFGC